MLSCKNSGYLFEHSEGIDICHENGTDFYVFVYFRTPAEAQLPASGGMQWQNAEGKAILYSPGSPQLYRSTSTPYVNDWLHIYCNDGGAFFAKTGLVPNTLFEVGDEAEVSRHLKALAALRGQGGPWAAEIAENELENLFYRLARGAGQPRHALPRRHRERLEDIRSQLYRSPRPGVRVAALAAQAGLSPSHFQALYREAFGISVGEDLIQSRLTRACFLLENSALSVNEVGRLSGYTCEEHFLRQFKKNTGKSPRQYRRAARPA